MSNKKINPNTLTDLEKLQILYVKFLKISHKVTLMKFEYSNEAKNYADNALASFMFKLYGLTDLPQVVSDEDYEKLHARELFRGIEDMDYHAELLCSEEYYKSNWHNGHGIFCTTTCKLAEGFARGRGSENVIKFKYPGKTFDRINHRDINFRYFMALKYGDYEGIKDENIIKKCKIFRKFINDKQSDVPDIKNIGYEYAEHRGKQDFGELITVDDTFMSVYLGFDCFDFDLNRYKYPEIVIQNRGKMVISLSEYNRICKASKNYKHCIKTEADLAPIAQLGLIL